MLDVDYDCAWWDDLCGHVPHSPRPRVVPDFATNHSKRLQSFHSPQASFMQLVNTVDGGRLVVAMGREGGVVEERSGSGPYKFTDLI